MPFLKLSLEMLPQTSLLRSGEPFYLIAVPFLANIPETMVMLHLAWRSIGIRVPIRRSLGPSVVVGLGACLVRQLVPLPFHILLNLALLMICTMIKGRVRITRALIGGVFAISVTIMGSSLIMEPLVILFRDFDFLKGSFGFTLGSLVETIVPLAVLFLFVKLNLTLLPRGRNTANSHAENAF